MISLTLRQMQAFVAVAQNQSYTKASAMRVSVVSPILSSSAPTAACSVSYAGCGAGGASMTKIIHKGRRLSRRRARVQHAALLRGVCAGALAPVGTLEKRRSWRRAVQRWIERNLIRKSFPHLRRIAHRASAPRHRPRAPRRRSFRRLPLPLALSASIKRRSRPRANFLSLSPTVPSIGRNLGACSWKAATQKARSKPLSGLFR